MLIGRAKSACQQAIFHDPGLFFLLVSSPLAMYIHRSKNNVLSLTVMYALLPLCINKCLGYFSLLSVVPDVKLLIDLRAGREQWRRDCRISSLAKPSVVGPLLMWIAGCDYNLH